MIEELPHNIEAEEWLLWSIIIDNSIIDSVDIDISDFYNEKNRVIFKALKKLREYNKKMDIVILKDFLKSKKLLSYVWWVAWITDIVDVCTHTTFWQSYSDIIKEHSNRRKIIAESIKMQKVWFDLSQEDVLDKISDISTKLYNKKKKWNGIVDIVDTWDNFMDLYKKQWGIWYKTPYPILDKYLWWIISWKVYTIVWYSWTGKSNFSYSFVTDWLKKWKKIIFFSLEVQKEMLLNLLLKSYYNISQKEILKDDFFFNMEDFKNLEVYDDIYSLDEMKSIVQSHNPDLVFIDFIQNVDTQWGSEYEKMTKVAQDIQKLAIKTNATIFSVSQANNDSRFKDTWKIQPKWSGAIFASSDIILALGRDWDNLQLNLMKNKFWISDKNFVIIPDFSKLQFNLAKEIQDDNVQNEQTDFSH